MTTETASNHKHSMLGDPGAMKMAEKKLADDIRPLLVNASDVGRVLDAAHRAFVFYEEEREVGAPIHWMLLYATSGFLMGCLTAWLFSAM